MPASRRTDRDHFPKGLYTVRNNYFVYRSPVSGRTVGLGRITEAEAFQFARVANDRASHVIHEKKAARVCDPHAEVDRQGLLQPDAIARKAMTFDRIIGVYFLLRDDEIVYVGQSGNILYRIACHRHDGEKEFNRIFLIECPEAQMEHLERLYIAKFTPKYNVKMHTAADGDKAWSQSIRAIFGNSLHLAK